MSQAFFLILYSHYHYYHYLHQQADTISSETTLHTARCDGAKSLILPEDYITVSEWAWSPVWWSRTLTHEWTQRLSAGMT